MTEKTMKKRKVIVESYCIFTVVCKVTHRWLSEKYPPLFLRPCRYGILHLTFDFFTVLRVENVRRQFPALWLDLFGDFDPGQNAHGNRCIFKREKHKLVCSSFTTHSHWELRGRALLQSDVFVTMHLLFPTSRRTRCGCAQETPIEILL